MCACMCVHALEIARASFARCLCLQIMGSPKKVMHFTLSQAHPPTSQDPYTPTMSQLPIFRSGGTEISESPTCPIGSASHFKVLLLALPKDAYVPQFYRPLNIRIVLVGVEVWTDIDKCSINQDPFTSLHEFLDWRKMKLLPRKSHDNAQLVR